MFAQYLYTQGLDPAYTGPQFKDRVFFPHLGPPAAPTAPAAVPGPNPTPFFKPARLKVLKALGKKNKKPTGAPMSEPLYKNQIPKRFKEFLETYNISSSSAASSSSNSGASFSPSSTLLLPPNTALLPLLREYADWLISNGFIKSVHTMISQAKQYVVLFSSATIDQKSYNFFFAKLKKRQKATGTEAASATPFLNVYWQKLSAADKKIGQLIISAGARIKSVESGDIVGEPIPGKKNQQTFQIFVPPVASKTGKPICLAVPCSKSLASVWSTFIKSPVTSRIERIQNLLSSCGLTKHSARRALAIICRVLIYTPSEKLNKATRPHEQHLIHAIPVVNKLIVADRPDSARTTHVLG